MSDLLAAIHALRERLSEIPQADERRLQDLKTELLGRKAGALTKILGALPRLDDAERRAVGGAANALKRELEEAIATRERALALAARAQTGIDLTMPGYQSQGRVVSAENGSIFTRTVSPPSQAGTQQELRLEADRLIQVDERGTPTPLVRCGN